MAANQNNPAKEMNPKAILMDAFPGTDHSGKPLVGDKTFRMSKDGEEICYWAVDYLYEQGNGGLYITKGEKKYQHLIDLNKCAEEGKKGFYFVTLERKYSRKYYSISDWLFSLEIAEFDTKIKHVQMVSSSTVISKLKSASEDIVRFPPAGGGAQIYIVAIRIGSADKRDYTALRHYIVSSDNRTYNKVVRSMIEYFTVEGQQTLKNDPKLPHNLLVSGAPGTGKSHFLEKAVEKAGEAMIAVASTSISKEAARARYVSDYVTRVTFYEDYSYENFVGCYKPVPAAVEAEINYDGKDGTITENKITYQFKSGPFIDTYIKAKKDKDHNYFLIIEEINRAKAAGVFGDMFQLLDRKDGVSEYDIKPDGALNEYLEENLDNYSGTMRLPANMYIWATMNSADQGVMPLDSAFKRRWAAKYMDLTGGAENDGRALTLPKGGSKPDETGRVLWGNLRTRINAIILNSGFEEDRCIGEWYFSPEEIAQINHYYEEDDDKRKDLVNPLIDKLFYYLRQDVFRRNPEAMFIPDIDSKGLDMSSIRRRARSGRAINSILKVNDLPFEKHSPGQDGSESVAASVPATDAPAPVASGSST